MRFLSNVAQNHQMSILVFAEILQLKFFDAAADANAFKFQMHSAIRDVSRNIRRANKDNRSNWINTF